MQLLILAVLGEFLQNREYTGLDVNLDREAHAAVEGLHGIAKEYVCERPASSSHEK